MVKSYLKSIRKVSGSFLLSVLLLFASALLSSCAYRLGSPDRSLPGGYRQVFVPIFKNRTQEPGIEVSFTNNLIQEFERAKIARVTDASQAEILVEGVIESVEYNKSATDLTSPDMPTGTVLATSYQIVVRTHIRLRRNSDKSVLWEGSFSRERTYNAPQVTAAVINTVNPLYNLSAKRQNIDVISFEMMSEAHDRMTENF